ncbi:MAG: hypothetical protein AB7U74_13065 [Afipia sp.]
MTEHQFPWSLLLAFVSISIGWILLFLLSRRLKQCHPTVWTETGEPSGVPLRFEPFGREWRNWEGNFQLLYNSCWGGRLTKLNDKYLTALVWFMRIVLVTGAIAAVAGPRLNGLLL